MQHLMRSGVLLATLAVASVAGAEYVNAAEGFAVTAPKGWKQVSVPGVVVAFVAPTTAAKFSVNTNVTVEPLPAGVTITQYAQAAQGTLKRVITDYKLVSSRNVTLGGVAGREQIFSGRQGEFSLYFMQTFALSGNKAYVLTGTTQLADKTKLTPVMAAFVKSFKFKR
ncbi:DcrB-related protein [Deinococcus oregonensis]|uniref:DcrB-related protein n=1 Tax=Deinococcus oregonensis TaxID=1805970 RepID=A0ABV6B3V6_9DEIO